MKLLFDESLSPKLVSLLADLFPGSESARLNGLAKQGDAKILEYANKHDFVLVSTDGDFEILLNRYSGAKAVILQSCNYPTRIAAEVIRRNAVRFIELVQSKEQLICLD